MNRLGKIVGIEKHPINAQASHQVYTYDGSHRLKNFDEGTLVGAAISGTPKAEEDFTLDALGNWPTYVKKTNGSTTLSQTRTHNKANEVLTASSWATPVHDLAGNLTTIPQPKTPASSYTLKYDAWNRLVEVKSGSNVVATFGYDGLHRRIVKTAGAVTYHYYYNEAWQCVEVRLSTETGVALEQYVWYPYYVDALALRCYDSDLNGNYTGTNELNYALHDANFNLTAIVNASNAVIDRYAYTPYGTLLVLDANFALDANNKSDVLNPYAYTGRRLDDETGLYYYRNRYYHAQLGRFVSRDPIEYLVGWNLYGYVNSNPTIATDPYGLADFKTNIVPHSDPVLAILDNPLLSHEEKEQALQDLRERQ